VSFAPTIRPITGGDIDAVATAMSRHPALVVLRHRRQEEGRGEYLIAWDGDIPVGQLVLRWDRDFPAPDGLEGVPYIEDVYVPHDQRGHGVGSQLLAAAETRAAQAGHERATLAVNVDNGGARRLYARSGYSEAPTGEHLQPWTHHDRHGRLHEHQERVVDFVKHVGTQTTD